MNKKASLPVSVLLDLYLRLRDEIEASKRGSLDPNDTLRAALAMAILQASVLIPNDILRIEEEVRRLLEPTLKGSHSRNHWRKLEAQLSDRRAA